MMHAKTGVLDLSGEYYKFESEIIILSSRTDIQPGSYLPDAAIGQYLHLAAREDELPLKFYQ